jgi:acyl-coenzyme A thioesterase PaaI-like protein
MQAPFEYVVVEKSDEEIAEDRRIFSGLAGAVRALSEASLRTTIDHEEATVIRHEIEAITDRLRRSQIEGSYGVTMTPDGVVLGYGNAVVGVRNPIAPPLVIKTEPDGRTSSEFELNALYEGPPGCVHGGVVALVLDQVLGESPAAGGTPGMTGTLTLRYGQPTALGKCSAAAWIDRREGVKTIVKGWLRNADGEITVEAEGIFILPRWAREELARSGNQPPRFE